MKQVNNLNTIDKALNTWHTIRQYYICSIMEAVAYDTKNSYSLYKRKFNVERTIIYSERAVRNDVAEWMKELYRRKHEETPEHGLLIVETSLKDRSRADTRHIRGKIRRLINCKSGRFLSMYEDALLSWNELEDEERENTVPIIFHSITDEARLCLNNTHCENGWMKVDGRYIFLNEPHATKLGGFDL